MAEETLEQKVNASQNEKEEKKKPVSTLESVIGEIGDLFNLGIGLAAPAAGYALTGNAGVPVVSAAYIAGSEGNLTSKKIRDESLSGAIWGTFLNYFTSPLKYLTKLGKTAYMTMLPFIANSVIPTTNYLIENKSPKGLFEKLRKNYWPNVKKTFKAIWPLNLLSALFFSQPAYIVGAIGLANYLYRKFVVSKKEEEGKEIDKTPYLVAASNVSYKLARNTTKGLFDAVYAIGSSLGDLYKTSPKSTVPKQESAPAHPEPAGAHP